MSLKNGHRTKRTAVCLRCRALKTHEARGLCKCCYNHLAENRVAGDRLENYALTDPARAAGSRTNWFGEHE